MKISVVIPAYNEEKSISSTLESLSAQVTKFPFEVILVDNNSTDKTIEVAKKYDKKMDLVIISETKKGRGQARKTGFAHANGEIIASTDADTTVPTDWVESIGNFFTRYPDEICITALCQYPSKKISIRLFNYILPIIYRLFGLILGHYWLSGFSFAIRKDAYFKAGEFNSTLDAQEDSELSSRVSKLGKVHYLPALTVNSSARRFNNGLIKGLVPYVKTFFYMKQGNFGATKLEKI